MHAMPNSEAHDAIVVGAGPAGSSAAYWLASAGLDVLLLEKATFPREKVCGDGLTPRGTRALVDIGIDVSEDAGWQHNKGVRVIAGGTQLDLPWPELTSFPCQGAVRPRADLDALLATRAVKAGADLREHTAVTDLVIDRTGRVAGVTAASGPEKRRVAYRAPVVLACDGASARTAQHLGLHRNDRRAMGVAIRRYYTSPRSDDDYLEIHALDDRRLLPGYGWIFGMGDGTVNVGLGVLRSSAEFGKTDYRAMLTRWLDATPEDWGLREATAIGPIRGAGLPMGFNRTPHYSRGMLLVGDSAGSASPLTGEGIPYAMESGKFAAEAVVQALARPAGPQRDRALHAYPARMAAEWGGYYRLGATLVKMIGRPAVMPACTRHGLSHPTLMRLVFKLIANLYDPRDGDLSDRIIAALTRITPAATGRGEG